MPAIITQHRQLLKPLQSDALWITDKLLQWAPWKAMMAAKTTAQLSKTVLSLMTQARNFETAMFFSVMQGHIGSQGQCLGSYEVCIRRCHWQREN